MYESIDKRTKLENENLKTNGLEIMSESDLYKCTVDGMAKHIVYGIITIINYKYYYSYILDYKFLITDCWKSTAIMSTNAVCFLLLKRFRNGTTVEQLALELSILRDKLSLSDRDIGFSGDSIDVVKHAVSI